MNHMDPGVGLALPPTDVTHPAKQPPTTGPKLDPHFRPDDSLDRLSTTIHIP
jgi:hypothetical protein